jgi:ArsR family transcriptional regulator, cadmium/lead-responsive transcriptional repressor
MTMLDRGLVKSRPLGRASMLSLAHPELFELLSAAEKQRAATGDAVVLCPTYAVGLQTRWKAVR